MPVYEYEPVDWDCAICSNRFEALQSIHEEALTHCPTCGLEVRRLISRAQIKVAKFHGAEHAGQKGFTTYKKVEEGKWERIGGEGADMIVGTAEDIAAVKEEKAAKPVPKLNLDAQD